MGVQARVNWKSAGWNKKLALWWNRDKLTADQIAERLRISRGAVLGKIHRMGWSRNTKSIFTDIQLKQINHWWNREGRSASWIARKLGVTKNRVIGKIHRMGWNGRVAGGRGGKDSNDLSRTPNNRFQWRSDGGDCGPLSIGKYATKIVVRENDPPAHERKSFADNTGCMWPFEEPDGKDTYCGCKKQSGKPYCAEHDKRAHITGSDALVETSQAILDDACIRRDARVRKSRGKFTRTSQW